MLTLHQEKQEKGLTLTFEDFDWKELLILKEKNKGQERVQIEVAAKVQLVEEVENECSIEEFVAFAIIHALDHH